MKNIKIKTANDLKKIMDNLIKSKDIVQKYWVISSETNYEEKS